MKILACVSSYRKRGNTARLVEMMGDALQHVTVEHDVALDLEIVYLGHQDVGMCRGCRVCFDRGEGYCPLDDDLLAIKEKMLSADAIIVASPVYVNDVNGIMKNWIDRLAHVCHRPEFVGKSVYLITTSGVTPTRHALSTLSNAFRLWGFHVAGQKAFWTGAYMPASDMQERHGTAVERAASTLFSAIQNQAALRPGFLSLMTFKIQQRYWQRELDKSTIDYRYWQHNGWLEAQQTYYIEHQSGHVKVTVARLVGSLIAPLVS